MAKVMKYCHTVALVVVSY